MTVTPATLAAPKRTAVRKFNPSTGMWHVNLFRNGVHHTLAIVSREALARHIESEWTR